MCFYDDSDWFSEVADHCEFILELPRRCDECTREIPAGSVMHMIYLQRYECCRMCDDEDPECEHDYGETDEYGRCDECDKILKAIEAHEADEGCPVHSRRPMLRDLRDQMIEHQSAQEYRARALSMFPELDGHPMLKNENMEK